MYEYTIGAGPEVESVVGKTQIDMQEEDEFSYEPEFEETSDRDMSDDELMSLMSNNAINNSSDVISGENQKECE